MISQRAHGLHTALLLCQALLVLVVLVTSMVVSFCFVTEANALQLGHYPIYGLIVVAGLALESLNRGSDKTVSNLSNRNVFAQHSISVRQTMFAAGALLAYLTAVKDPFISRTVLLLYLPALYAVLLWSNYVLPRRLARRFFSGAHKERALLIGPAVRASRLEAWLAEKEIFGLETIGILSEDDVPEGRLPQLGRPADLKRVLAEHKVTHAILLELPDSSSEHESVVDVLENQGVRFVILSNLEEKLRHPAVHFEDGDLAFVAPRRERLEDPANRIIKRVLDVSLALPIVTIFMPPVALVIWVLHRLQSPGPLLFRQVRAGIQNHPFEILKFRTMHPKNRDEGGPASRDAGQVFPAGRWLRRLSIDEIPQFWNVLRGEMSVVGPRPHMLGDNAQFSRQMARYHIRASVKPGVTGLAQVRGFRGDVQSADDIRHRLESDISYLENWRLALDVTIIFRTALQTVLFFMNRLVARPERASGSQPADRAPHPAGELAAGPLKIDYVPRPLRREFRRILGIRFFIGNASDAVALGMQGGLVVAPSAPVLLGLEVDPAHREAVVSNGLAITDSGLMVLLWKLMTGESISRVSGLVYLKLLLEQPEVRRPGAAFWVMPNKASMQRNFAWLRSRGFVLKEEDCYIAPQYDTANREIEDPALLKLLQAKKPAHILMALGGGVQEKLGAHLYRNLDYRPAIHCTGAAIGFLSGDQVRIPLWADRLRLGWLCRCIHEPRRFIPRYWEARKLVGLMFDYHGRLPGPVQTSRSV